MNRHSRPRSGGVSRRTFLRAGGAAAAGGVVGGSAWLTLGGGTSTAALAPRAGLPRLAAAAAAQSGTIQHYRSTPGISPATVQVGKAGTVPGLILMDNHAGPGQQGPIIIDGSGQLVWFQPLSPGGPSGLRAFNLSLQSYRDKPVLAFFKGYVVDGHGQGHYVLLDSTYREIKRIYAGNGYKGDLHEFFLTPRGTAMFTCYGQATADLRPYGGKGEHPYYYGVAQEVDLTSGKVVFQWRSDQHVALSESYAPVEEDQPWDYFHINSIDIAPDGNYIISARDTWTVYKVDSETGKVLWRMGGKHSDFRFGPGAKFAWQHHVEQRTAETWTVFDNGSGWYVTEPYSRGLVLTVSERSRTVSLVHAYTYPGGPIRAAALGSVQPLPGGGEFVGWGNDAAYSAYDASGSPVAYGRSPGPTKSYRAFVADWVGRPRTAPALVAGTGHLYASWNGATEVASWLVMGGKQRDHLTQVGTAPRMGFETVITAPAGNGWFSVAALDAHDNVLGSSAAVPLA